MGRTTSRPRLWARALDNNELCERPFAVGETTAVGDVDIFVVGSGLREIALPRSLGRPLSPPCCRAVVARRQQHITRTQDDEGIRAQAETIAHVVGQASEFAT